MSFASLGGVAVTAALVQSPAWGRLWADVTLAQAVDLSGAQVLAIADWTQAVTIVSGGTYDGVSRYRCVAGAAGWGRALAKRGYANDAGVNVASIVADAARDCGETMGAPGTGTVGHSFSRVAGEPASAVLDFAAPSNWYIDTAGVTQIGLRPDVNYTGTGARVRTDPALGVIELATDTIGALVPGVVVDGAPAATDVEYELDPKRLTVRVYHAAKPNRRLAAMRRLVDAVYPALRFSGTWEYRVVTQSGYRLNLQPARVASGMPDLARVPVRPGVPGFRADVALGSLVLVAFADGSPGRPYVIAHPAPDAPGWMPTLVEFGDSGDFVARKSAVDALQQAFDSHSHTVATTGSAAAQTGTAAPITSPVGPQESADKFKA